MAATIVRKDPHVAAFFRIEIDGIDGGSFNKCMGLKSETEIFEYQEGGNNDYVLKLVGQSRANNIILSSGVITDLALYKWRDEIFNGGAAKIKRRNGSVIVLARDGQTQLARWNFQNAWPVRWELSDLDTSTGVGSCQILELAVERIVKG